MRWLGFCSDVWRQPVQFPLLRRVGCGRDRGCVGTTPVTLASVCFWLVFTRSSALHSVSSLDDVPQDDEGALQPSIEREPVLDFSYDGMLDAGSSATSTYAIPFVSEPVAGSSPQLVHLAEPQMHASLRSPATPPVSSMAWSSQASAEPVLRTLLESHSAPPPLVSLRGMLGIGRSGGDTSASCGGVRASGAAGAGHGDARGKDVNAGASVRRASGKTNESSHPVVVLLRKASHPIEPSFGQRHTPFSVAPPPSYAPPLPPAGIVERSSVAKIPLASSGMKNMSNSITYASKRFTAAKPQEEAQRERASVTAEFPSPLLLALLMGIASNVVVLFWMCAGATAAEADQRRRVEAEEDATGGMARAAFAAAAVALAAAGSPTFANGRNPEPKANRAFKDGTLQVKSKDQRLKLNEHIGKSQADKSSTNNSCQSSLIGEDSIVRNDKSRLQTAWKASEKASGGSRDIARSSTGGTKHVRLSTSTSQTSAGSASKRHSRSSFDTTASRQFSLASTVPTPVSPIVSRTDTSSGRSADLREALTMLPARQGSSSNSAGSTMCFADAMDLKNAAREVDSRRPSDANIVNFVVSFSGANTFGLDEADKEAEQRRKAASAELKQATASGDAEYLRSAIAEGRAAGLDASEFDQPERTLAEDLHRAAARDSLTAALAAGEIGAVREAIDSAKAAGLPANDLDGAKCQLAHLERVEAARAKLDAALNGGSEDILRTAIDEASVEGVASGDAVEAAKAALARAIRIEELRDALATAEGTGVDDAELDTARSLVAEDTHREALHGKVAEPVMNASPPETLRDTIEPVATPAFRAAGCDSETETLAIDGCSTVAHPSHSVEKSPQSIGGVCADEDCEGPFRSSTDNVDNNEQPEDTQAALENSANEQRRSDALEALRGASQGRDLQCLVTSSEEGVAAGVADDELDNAESALAIARARASARVEVLEAAEALASSGSGRDMQRLRQTLEAAEAAGFQPVELEAARSALGAAEVAAKAAAEARLEEIISRQRGVSDIGPLRAAIETAKDVGIASFELLQNARQRLAAEEWRADSLEELRLAMQSGESRLVRAAIDEAAASGLQCNELDVAKAIMVLEGRRSDSLEQLQLAINHGDVAVVRRELHQCRAAGLCGAPVMEEASRLVAAAERRRKAACMHMDLAVEVPSDLSVDESPLEETRRRDRPVSSPPFFGHRRQIFEEEEAKSSLSRAEVLEAEAREVRREWRSCERSESQTQAAQRESRSTTPECQVVEQVDQRLRAELGISQREEIASVFNDTQKDCGEAALMKRAELRQKIATITEANWNGDSMTGDRIDMR
eukprot:TRINITY_DN5217_c0_g1_i1.p1 TRINITY_DN5217_c0_g1~~TRINITY_DN5217_c0_g1_i1.p1  ORF type:complete len:1322 (-),score=273.41 TRINITY_DN5217_c0_g1_i1:123-4088(-)